MVAIKESRMEVLFGFFGTLFILIILIVTAFLTPGYSPVTHTISTLGTKNAQSLFSIGFVVAGSSLIPFYIYLKNELVYLEDNIRRIATGIAIFTNMCIALVGIIPPADDAFMDAFQVFHNIVAGVSFIGSSIYIVLYSILMYLGPKSAMYKGPEFKKYLAYYGFLIGFFLVLLLITLNPLVEWILAMSILTWILITAWQCISFKFSKIPGVYYKRSQYPEALKLFKDAINVLDNLELGDEPITETLKENIEFIKDEMEKESIKQNQK
ncbi:MAG: DUF998 domain-containing protein [Candidatus Lokiarchaeota archaeon]|nr:DUF998 domain-containing protein [Candidatus Lokiarchaeota archaeon]